MRRTVVRASCLVLLATLLLSLSVPSMRTSAQGELQVAVPAVAAGDAACTSSIANVDGRYRWRVLLDQPDDAACGRSPATVLIVGNRVAPGAASTADTRDTAPAAPIAGATASWP